MDDLTSIIDILWECIGFLGSSTQSPGIIINPQARLLALFDFFSIGHPFLLRTTLSLSSHFSSFQNILSLPAIPLVPASY